MRIFTITLHVADFLVELQIICLQTPDLGAQFRDYLELLAKFLCKLDEHLKIVDCKDHAYFFKFSVTLTEAVTLAGDNGKNGCIGGGCERYRFRLCYRILLSIARVRICTE